MIIGHTSLGHAIPDVYSEPYTLLCKPKGYLWTVSMRYLGFDGGKYLRPYMRDWTPQEHVDATKLHLTRARQLAAAHGKLWPIVFKQHFGRLPWFHEFRVSAIGCAELPLAAKDALRYLAQTATMHKDCAHLHWAGSGKRKSTYFAFAESVCG